MIMLNTFERRLKHEIEQLTARSSRATGQIVYAELSHAIVGAAIESPPAHRSSDSSSPVLRADALRHELVLCEIPHRAQVPIPMLYKGCAVGDYVADLIVDDKIVVELKAVAALQAGTHGPDALSYKNARDAIAAGLAHQLQRAGALPWRSPTGSVSTRSGGRSGARREPPASEIV